jgi:hypothetical protein
MQEPLTRVQKKQPALNEYRDFEALGNQVHQLIFQNLITIYEDVSNKLPWICQRGFDEFVLDALPYLCHADFDEFCFDVIRNHLIHRTAK